MRYVALLFVVLVGLLSQPATAIGDVVVVVNPANRVEHLTRGEVVNIFLGRFRQFSSGVAAQPIDLPLANPSREEFYRLLVGKSLAEINAYWARLVFSGQTMPPLQAAQVEDAVGMIQLSEGGISYMERNKVGGRLKIVFDFSN